MPRNVLSIGDGLDLQGIDNRLLIGGGAALQLGKGGSQITRWMSGTVQIEPDWSGATNGGGTGTSWTGGTCSITATAGSGFTVVPQYIRSHYAGFRVNFDEPLGTSEPIVICTIGTNNWPYFIGFPYFDVVCYARNSTSARFAVILLPFEKNPSGGYPFMAMAGFWPIDIFFNFSVISVNE